MKTTPQAQLARLVSAAYFRMTRPPLDALRYLKSHPKEKEKYAMVSLDRTVVR